MNFYDINLYVIVAVYITYFESFNVLKTLVCHVM